MQHHQASVARGGAHGLAPPQGEVGPGPIGQSSPPLLIGRVLLVVLMCAAAVHAWTIPAERDVPHLLAALSAGDVQSVTMDRPNPDAQGQTQLRVEWTQTGRDGYAYYESNEPGSVPRIDEGETILLAVDSSPAEVDLTIHDGISHPGGVQWNYFGLLVLAALMVLIFGPRPRLATRWGWFWVGMAMPVLWPVFLVLEPVPAWRRQPAPVPPRKLTGGWAFLLALVLGQVWNNTTTFWP